MRCKKQKPTGVNNYVLDPALLSLQAGKEIPWQEAVDPASYQMYVMLYSISFLILF
jgi:hypothetical protein